MKALIWFGSALLVAIVNVGLGFAGLRLGAIPMVLLFAGASSMAKALCRKWDERSPKTVRE